MFLKNVRSGEDKLELSISMLDEFDEYVIFPDNVKNSDISEKLKNEMTVF